MYTRDTEIQGNFTTSINFANPLNTGFAEGIVGRPDTQYQSGVSDAD